jgi:hypothetical protein
MRVSVMRSASSAWHVIAELCFRSRAWHSTKRGVSTIATAKARQSLRGEADLATAEHAVWSPCGGGGGEIRGIGATAASHNMRTIIG